MIADKGDLPLLQRLTASDPEIAVDGNGKKLFPTRAEALKTIDAIRKSTELAK